MIFDFFKKDDYTNVVPFPGTVPYIEPLKKEPAQLYSIGVTNDNRMRLNIGNSQLTMTKEGCHDLIMKLEVFKNQLKDKE